MKRLSWSLLILTILLTACATPAAPAPAPTTSAPVEAFTAPSADVVVASAKTAPAQIVELGFTISALVDEVNIKEGDTVQAGQTLMALDVPDLEYAVVAAEEAFRSADITAQLQKADKVKYVNPNNGVVSFLALPKEVYAKARSKADQAYAALETAQATLAQATLTSPIDGTVVSVKVIPGEVVQVGQVVITIAVLDSLQITTTDLSERDIPRVQIGQSVDVYIEALDVTVKGSVLRISPISEVVGGDVVYPVTIMLEKQPAGLLWGMSAEVEIQTK
ncbi:MAG: efflux RND transporter periplasmic adaptor subunit [Anaerolineales bacterium]|nr:efflux RND transporter periplasmic adaptor subunit [Anaerolineales bacterium]